MISESRVVADCLLKQGLSHCAAYPEVEMTVLTEEPKQTGLREAANVTAPLRIPVIKVALWTRR